MGYKETHDAEKEEIRSRQEEVRITEAFYDFYLRNRDVISCEANTHLIKAYFSEDMKKITVQTLEEALQHPELRQQIAFQSEVKERSKLVKFIIENRQMSPETRDHEFARLSSKQTAIETLREISDNIKRKRELESKTVPELRSIVKGDPQSQWKPVPALYRSKNMLLSLASENLDEFKMLVRRCGKEQIDAILQQSETD